MGNEPFFLSMKQLRWQILVVLVTLGIVAVLLFSQQSPGIGGPILPQPEQGGVYTEAWWARWVGLTHFWIGTTPLIAI